MQDSAAKASCCLRRHASGSFGLGWCSPQMHRVSHIPSSHWLPIASKQSERPCWTILKQPTARHCHSAVRYRLVPLMIPLLRLTCMKIQSADSSALLRLFLEDFCNSASRSSMCPSYFLSEGLLSAWRSTRKEVSCASCGINLVTSSSYPSHTPAIVYTKTYVGLFSSFPVAESLTALYATLCRS